MIVGWSVVAAYAGLLVWAGLHAVDAPDLDRGSIAADGPAERFAAAWGRSRRATVVTSGTYERHSDVNGSTLSSVDVVAQRPPRRLHRQLGGIEGRDDDRLLVCPAAPAGSEAPAEPCHLGPPGGPSYEESVTREVDGVRSLTVGDNPLYRVRDAELGCFDLEQLRVDPRAPFGREASFCFDADTGAVAASRVRHEGGIVEVLTVTSIRTDVSDADLEP